MLRFSKLLVVLLALFIVPTIAQAQVDIKVFSADSTKYLEELTDMFLNVEGRRKEGKDLIEEFTKYWFGGVFDEKQRKDVYKTSNFMLKYRMKPYPEFSNYIFTLISFKATNQPAESFDSWQFALDKLIENKKKSRYTDYLIFSKDLFAENAIYSSNSVKWVASNNTYKFGFEDDNPTLTFQDINLKCLAKGDSSIIYNTKGVYYPIDEKWKGFGGKITWERAGISPDTAYALLRGYEISTKSSLYSLDSVTFYNKKYFQETPLIGSVNEKVLANVEEDKASYPRFQSYEARYKIPNIAPGVDFDGGFLQQGGKVVGAGTDENPAYLYFKREDQVFIKAYTDKFIINDDKIVSNRAAMVLYLGEDSISHPGLILRLKIDTASTLELIREDVGISKTPFFDSYHNLDMFVEKISWKIGDPRIFLGTLQGTSNKEAKFESINIFDMGKMEKYLGISSTHPFFQINKCVEKHNSKILSANDIAYCMDLPPSEVRSMLMMMATDGFVSYNYKDNTVVVKDKLLFYIKARSKSTDFDVITIDSQVESGNNAAINLLNYEISIVGIERIKLSDAHKVSLFPNGGKIIMGKNRDFTFSGVITAGRIQYFGKEFAFTYDKFLLDMPEVDSMRLKAVSDQLDDRGNKKLVPVKTVIEDLKGELQIDHPRNKSGNRDLPQFPIFKCVDESYAYYDKTMAGVYPRDKFYFKLEPFVFDSLDKFTNDGINFKGAFVSAGIFPDFDETLTLQKDYSLGFTRATPPEGFDMYGGKAKIKGDINMSNKGLKTDGTLAYLTSLTESNDFTFFPDSMNAVAQKFNLDEVPVGTEFPTANAENVKVHWRPYLDFMLDRQITEPIKIYREDYVHHGYTKLSPTGYEGTGYMAFEGAEMHGQKIKYHYNTFESDTCDFNLNSPAMQQLGFESKNLKGFVDLVKRKGTFVTNGTASPINFKINQYMAYMDRFVWNMDSEEIALSAGESKLEGLAADLNLEGARFVSTHPEQDSLDFYSKEAIYDYRRNIIRASEVKFMLVADAILYPDSERVVIRPKAVLDPLENSRIVANITNRYHNFYECNTNVYAKKKYNSSGKYDFVNALKTIQTVNMTTIKADSSGQTIAIGNVDEAMAFTMGPQYEFKGDLKITASVKNITFSGNTRIAHTCEAIAKPWFQFTSEIDPEEIYIPITGAMTDEAGKALAIGFMMAFDSIHVYPAFISKPVRDADYKLLTSEGFLFYDETTSEYKIGSQAKLLQPSLPGQYLTLNTNTCELYGEGKVDFGVNLGRVELTSVGSMKMNTVTKETTLDVVLLADFLMQEKSMETMAKTMAENTSLDGVKTDTKIYELGLQEILGKDEADKAISSLQLYGNFKKFPEGLNKTLFVNDLKMYWNQESSSFRTLNTIGVGNVYTKQVNKINDGRIEIIKRRTGDIMHVYFELGSKSWYYFNYQKNVMYVISSDDEFNTAVKEEKSDKRKMKTEKGQAPYSYVISSSQKRDLFLKRFVKVD